MSVAHRRADCAPPACLPFCAQEVTEWSRAAGRLGDYTSTALHSAGRGRVRSADAPAESLYAEMGSWVDPATVGAALSAAAARRKRPLAGAELAMAKQRKAERKEQKQRAWLLE